MRYGVISDIHSNLEALVAVIEALKADRADEYLCVGDLVGYGADPGRCIDLVRSLKPAGVVAGNHDRGAVGTFDLEYFNDHARVAAEWTEDVLTADHAKYLKSLKLTYRGDDLTMVHGSLADPEEFNYILCEDDAYMTFQLMNGPLCFIGHSHVPGIFVLGDNDVELAKTPKTCLEDNKKYIVNAGSVGQPRDGDPRAAYVLYDTKDMTVEIKRVSYDIESAGKKIIIAGLPRSLAERLLEGR